MTAERTEDRTRQARVAEAPSAAAQGPRIAYLLSQYPARSHTFFLHEVLGLRARGLHIETASINSPDRSRHELPEAEAMEGDNTFYIKQLGAARGLLAVAATLLTKPSVVARGLGAILRLPALSLKGRAFWLFYLAEAILLGRWMRARGLPHLHVHFGGAVASVGMLTSIAWDIPYSLTIHGPEELLNPQGYHLHVKLLQAEFILCISEFCRDELQRLLPPDHWSKLTVIRLGVDPLLLAPAVQSAQHEPLTLVCVGRLVPEKGQAILLEALSCLRTRGIALRALFVGAGVEQQTLERYVQTQAMQDAVTFTSGLSHEAALACVRRADIFALASFAEGVPVALMEAMSLAIPCVSTTVAGIPELIQSGESGLLVPAGNVSALVGALEAFATGAALRSRMGQAGRRKVIAEYNLPLNLERLASFFRNRLACDTTPQRTPNVREHA